MAIIDLLTQTRNWLELVTQLEEPVEVAAVEVHRLPFDQVFSEFNQSRQVMQK